ncbi:MAG: hypothetical protein LBG92_03120 [Prevotellaceae bacterium]|jgi:hypothetical protein|nr:hypothetical protein [Prevotellaceae bacterium]
MSTQTTTYIINAAGNATQVINGISGAANSATQGVDSLHSRIAKLVNIGFVFSHISSAYSRLSGMVDKYVQANNAQQAAETKLRQVMRNTMSATDEQARSVMELASAQQELGVIGDEVQLAGAAELATYLEKTDTLKKLIPAMNDTLAHQYGLNASQEQAVNIATMVGKVMQGQTGALSRFGYSYNKAQEKVLKFGTEEQKAAMLSDIMAAAVGGVNAALAATPEGKWKQHQNVAGNLDERIGKLVANFRAALLPALKKISEFVEKIIAFFERHSEKIQQFFSIVAEVVVGTISLLAQGVKILGDAVGWLFEQIKNGEPVMTSLAIMIGSIAAALAIYKVWTLACAVATGIATVATTIWTSAQAMLNAVMYANPIYAIIALIIALVATIAYAVYITDGWGKTWDNVMTWMGLGIDLFASVVKLVWLRIQDAFITGFEIIKTGWYKLKSLWDKEGAHEGLAAIEADRNRRAMEILEQTNKAAEIAQKMRDMKVFELEYNGKNIGTLVNGMKNKLGIGGGANKRLQQSVETNTETSVGSLKTSVEATATGGSRSTVINVKIDKGVGDLYFNGTTKENSAEIERNIAAMFYRILGFAETAAG